MTNSRIEKTVREAIYRYIDDLDGEAEPVGIYHLMVSEVERAVIRTVLEYHHNNQSRTAKCLGITRNTLKKKIRKYGLDECP